MEHELKTIQPYFDDVKNGVKTFDLRNNFRNFQIGDILILKEYSANSGYTGQEIRKKVSYILKDCPHFGLQEGFCIMGLVD